MGDGTGGLPSELRDPQAEGGEHGRGSAARKQAVDVVPGYRPSKVVI